MLIRKLKSIPVNMKSCVIINHGVYFQMHTKLQGHSGSAGLEECTHLKLW